MRSLGHEVTDDAGLEYLRSRIVRGIAFEHHQFERVEHDGAMTLDVELLGTAIVHG